MYIYIHIYPHKCELQKVSKLKLRILSTKLHEKLHVNQRTNTEQVDNWFNNIKDKTHQSFIQFNIVDFYPNISCELLETALNFAQQYIPVSDDDFKIIISAKNSLLYHNGAP